MHCLLFLQIICTPFSLSQEVDKSDGFRSSEIHAPLIVRDSSSDVSNAQYPRNDYPNRKFYHSARPAHDLSLSILGDGTSDITLNDVYKISGEKHIYDDALGDAFFRMVGFASSSIYLATLGEDMIVRNLHYTLLVGFKGATEPLPSVDSCGVHRDTACLQWAQTNNLLTGSYYFNEVSLCAAAYGIGNLAEIQRAGDGYESKMIKWTRVPLGKFDVVSQPGRINYFMTYYAKAKFQIYVMTEGMVNCVDETLSIIYHDCPENTAYPHEPCVYETPHSICTIKLIGTTDNSEYTCEYFNDVLRLRKANIPSDPPFDPLEVDQQRVLKSDNTAALKLADLTHLLPSGVSRIISCYMNLNGMCTYLNGGWSELFFDGCKDGFTAITETGQERCVATNRCDGVGVPVVTPYLPSYEISETVYEVDLVQYSNHYQHSATEFERQGFPRIATFTRGATGKCEVACLTIPDGEDGTYYTDLPTNEAITAAENLCESSNVYGETFYPHVDRKPVTACQKTLVAATPFTDAVCTCPEGLKFAEVTVNGVTQLDVTRCVECDRCEEGKIAEIQCGTAWRYYLKRTRDFIMLWPLVDANSEYSVKHNTSAIDQTFTYFNIDQVCGPCATCQSVQTYVWTDCSGLTRECRPCNCSGNVTNDQICIVDDCRNTYSDNTVPRPLSDLQCDSGQWRNISDWADDENRSYTTAQWKNLRCVDCVLIADANRNMFDLSTTSDPKIRCLNRINDEQIFTTGKRPPECSGADDSLPSCENCPSLPDHASWLYISAENESDIGHCDFACDEHYVKVLDDEQGSYVCSPCWDAVNNRVVAKEPCSTGYYRSSCRPNEATECLPCSPGNCSTGEWIRECVNGYDINMEAASAGLSNECVACNNDVICETNQQYRNCTGFETADFPLTRCDNCTGQNIPDNSEQPEDSCIAYCLPYFYHHVNPDDPSEFTCEPCPQTDHGIHHFCCGDTEEDCGKTLEVSDECAKPGKERGPAAWVPSCVCKPGWESTDGNCELCNNWKVSTDGTECNNCAQGGTQGNRKIGADVCEECPRSYYRSSQATHNQCLPCASGTDGRTGAEDCPSGFKRCQDGKRRKYDVDGVEECGQCDAAEGAETFWTGTYDIFGITAN